MTGNLDEDFVRDMARLLRKYGPSPFTDFAELLRDEASRNLLITDLENLALASASVLKRAGTPRSSSAQRKIKRLIEVTRESDEGKAGQLEVLYKMISAGGHLRNKEDLSAFAARLGINVDSSRTRNDALLSIITKAADLDHPTMENLVKMLRDESKSNDELGKWSDIIAGRG